MLIRFAVTTAACDPDFRKHARESALTSLGALLVLFGSLFFGGRPRSRRAQSGDRSSRFGYRDSVSTANGDAGICLTSPDKSALLTHRTMSSNASKAHQARDAPHCGQLPIVAETALRPGMGINADSSCVER
jgi:hypothetical protein